MFQGKSIAVLIPAYQEERQIAAVLTSIPDWVDTIVVIDDASTDRTSEVVRGCAASDGRIELITLPKNRGVGGALAEGYGLCVRSGVDVAVTIDGDGQMDIAELEKMIEPIVSGVADYAKGNRLVEMTEWASIPKVRLFGNAVLSLLTKIASGYWGLTDFQSGFTAAGRKALENIDWQRIYPRYGRPNDVVVQANIANCRVMDVPIRALYGVGEQSTMKVRKVVLPILKLLFRRFWERLWIKYVVRDFHPLVFFYLYSSVSAVVTGLLSIRLVFKWIVDGHVPIITSIGLAIALTTFLNSTFFAFWMDMQSNDGLVVRYDESRSQRGVS